MTSLDDLVARADVVVCCGSGGVGKTTSAGALGMQAARRGRRAVVVTIDPAKRLADAFGLAAGLTNDPAPVELDDAPGELWAMMLDTEATFDELVRRHATDPLQAERILANRFYRNIAGALSGTHEYMAAEKLRELHADARFDLVVVDTPPARNALDFLQAPDTLSRFLDHTLFRALMMPARRSLKVVNVAAQPVLRSIGKVVGGDVLSDTLAFFQAFAGMEHGFRQRADEVQALLRAEGTVYVVVASARRDTADEALHFIAQLAAAGLAPSALLLNRLHPTFGAEADPATGAAAARREARRCERLGDEVMTAAWGNLAELRELAAAERSGLGDLLAAAEGAVVASAPLLPGDVHDLAGLDEVRQHLFDEVRQHLFDEVRQHLFDDVRLALYGEAASGALAGHVDQAVDQAAPRGAG